MKIEDEATSAMIVSTLSPPGFDEYEYDRDDEQRHDQGDQFN